MMMMFRGMSDEQMEQTLRDRRPQIDAQVDALANKMYGEDGNGGQLAVLARDVIISGAGELAQQQYRLA